MARYYYVLAVFGKQSDAEACAALFRERMFTLTSGMSFRCTVNLSRSDNSLYWLACEPEGVNYRPGCDVWLKNAGHLDEVAALLYQVLRSAEHFLCAIAGWEVEDLFLPGPECGYEANRVEPADFLSPGLGRAGGHRGIMGGNWEAKQFPAIFPRLCLGTVPDIVGRRLVSCSERFA